MATNLQDLSILVVEDEADLRQLFVWDLEDKGVVVEVAESYQEATEKLLQKEYDVILSDIKLPDKTGIELFEFLIAQSIEVKQRYLMTAYTSAEISIDHLKVDKLFKKPLKTKEVIDYLLNHFN